MLNRGNTFRYPEVGRCIYCDASDQRLTDEHIIPYALGGHLVLPKSSCLRCAAVTHTYEYTTLRHTLGYVRMRLNFPTRRKKDRPTHVEIGTISKHGQIGRIKVPVAEYPVGTALPGFSGRANILYGAPANLDTLGRIAQSFYLQGDAKAFIEKYDWDGRLAIKWMPIEFGQMIIKMAYSYAIAELGLGSFTPICLDHILKRDLNISHVFGQHGKNTIKEDSLTNVWEINLYLIIAPATKVLLVASCSLFPSVGTPIYEVVLGRIDRPDQAKEWAKQLREKRLVVSIPQAPQAQT